MFLSSFSSLYLLEIQQMSDIIACANYVINNYVQNKNAFISDKVYIDTFQWAQERWLNGYEYFFIDTFFSFLLLF